jgi:proteasome accessory factor C
MSGALARLERILLMVPWLLEHPGAELEEVAERFGMGVDELAGDLDVLGYCGVPGYGGGDLVEVSLVAGRVTVRMADFFRRPLRLSLREALTLVLAGRALQGIGGSDELRSALAKLEHALGGTDAGVTLDFSAPGDEHLPVLREAVASGEVVHLTYRSASKAETTERDVEPWSVTGFRGSWYLQGWCRLAEAPRDFRLDRIREVRPLGEPVPADRPRRADPPAYIPAPDDATVVLDLRGPAWWVSEWLVCDEIEEKNGIRRITMRTGELEWVARLLLRLGPDAAVASPPELAGRVRALADQALRRYRKA